MSENKNSFNNINNSVQNEKIKFLRNINSIIIPSSFNIVYTTGTERKMCER